MHEHLKRRLFVAQKSVTAATKLSPATVNVSLETLTRLGVVARSPGANTTVFMPTTATSRS